MPQSNKRKPKAYYQTVFIIISSVNFVFTLHKASDNILQKSIKN